VQAHDPAEGSKRQNVDCLAIRLDKVYPWHLGHLFACLVALNSSLKIVRVLNKDMPEVKEEKDMEQKVVLEGSLADTVSN
jgi:hypothetical protein